MLLASVSEIRTDLGFDDMQDVTDAITAAVDAAEPVLVAALRTEFGTASISDVFYVNSSELHAGVYRTELRLSRGFATVTGVVYADRISELSSGTSILSDVTVKGEKGLVIDYQNDLSGKYVQVTGTAGFAVDQNDATSYDLDDVPDWLQEAAKLQARILLDTHPAISDAGVKQDLPAMRRSLNVIIEGHTRYAPAAIKPING